MRGGRLSASSRRAGLTRLLALGITGVVLSRNSSAESHHESVPANAPLATSETFEGYPQVGALQGTRIAQEVIGSSIRSMFRAPLTSTRQILERKLERLTGHGAEQSSQADMPWSSDRAEC